MALDRGVLARADRRVFSELDHGKGTQLVNLPVSDAVWSTWLRYCDVAGVSMGGAIGVLIEHELSTVDDPHLDHMVALVARPRARLEERELALSQREGEVESERRRHRALESLLEARAARQRPAALPRSMRPGRNDPCPCGSGRKYKSAMDLVAPSSGILTATPASWARAALGGAGAFPCWRSLGGVALLHRSPTQSKLGAPRLGAPGPRPYPCPMERSLRFTHQLSSLVMIAAPPTRTIGHTE